MINTCSTVRPYDSATGWDNSYRCSGKKTKIQNWRTLHHALGTSSSRCGRLHYCFPGVVNAGGKRIATATVAATTVRWRASRLRLLPLFVSYFFFCNFWPEKGFFSRVHTTADIGRNKPLHPATGNYFDCCFSPVILIE